MEDSVTTFHELATGDDTKGAGALPQVLAARLLLTLRCRSEFHGMDMDALTRVVRLMEVDGLAKVFKGASSLDDQGIKFFASAG